jgi:diguanylate cyclase (GGDEF)-like protein
VILKEKVVRLQNHAEYASELKFDKNRLYFLFISTFFSFLFFKRADADLSGKIFLESIFLLALTFISLVHYFFILRYPSALIVGRKLLLLFLDLLLLTFSIAAFGHDGLFLFPLYIIIIMQNGLYFGIHYFYTGLATASALWIALLSYSDYWQEHSDIIATFAITTFLIPLFYLNYIIEAHKANEALSEELSIVAEDAYHDGLTGLANRKTYEEELKEAFKEKEFFALMFIDLNKFKTINDTYGHHTGDEVLREVARRLNAQIDEDDFLARLGGDEFAIISRKKKVFLPKFIKKIEKNVIGYHEIGKIRVDIKLSLGISMYPDDAKSSIMLAKYADVAMYAAKKRENCHHVFYKDIAAKKDVGYL